MADVPSAASGEVEVDEEADEKVEKPVMWEMPYQRFNAQLAVQEDTLYIYGGTFEKGDREFTFDEMWSIELGKLDGVKEVFKRELEDRQGSEDEDSEEDEEEDEESDDEEEEEDGAEPDTPASSVATDEPRPENMEETEADIAESEASVAKDDLPQPRPFEALREFFTRTSNEWQDVILDGMRYEREVEDRSVKEIRKKAFDRAERKWWEMREV